MPWYLRLFAAIVMAGLTAVALTMSVIYYQSAGTDEATRYVYTAVAILSACLKPLAAAMLPYLSRWPLQKFACVVVFFAAVAFDGIGVKGFVDMTKGQNIAETSAAASAYARAKEKRDRTRAAADEYKDTKPVAAIKPELSRLKAAAGDCANRRSAGSDACLAIAKHEADLALSLERERLEAEAAKAQAEFDKLEEPVSAPESSTETAGRFSFTSILSVLIFILFEVGIFMASFAAFHGGEKSSTPGKPEKSEKPPARGPSVPPRPPREASAAGPIGIYARLQDISAGRISGPGVDVAGSRISGGQRAIAALCGTTAPTLGRALKALEAADRLKLHLGANGTVIELK